MKLFQSIKFGFGFYVGYTIAKTLDTLLAEAYKNK